MLRTSFLTDSSTSATQLVVEYDEVDGGGGKSVEKLSKVEKPQKGLKNLQSGSEEPSFLTFDTRLAVRKIGPSQNSGQNLQWKTTGYCCSLQELEALPGSRKPIIIASDGSEIQRTRASVRFAEPRSSLDTTFGLRRSLWCFVTFFLRGVRLNPSALSFYLRNTRPPSATSILEMRSGRRRASPRSGRRCSMGWEDV